jgi:hypothetical protein
MAFSNGEVAKSEIRRLLRHFVPRNDKVLVTEGDCFAALLLAIKIANMVNLYRLILKLYKL